MLTKIPRAPRMAHRRPETGSSIESSAMQTRRSWAQAIGSYAALPGAYREFFEPLRADGLAFPYTVLTPRYEGFIHRAAEKVICILGPEICVLERRGRSFSAQRYPLEAISQVEVATVLLNSQITISGLTRDGIPAASTFRFNSVTDYLFASVVERIRLVGAESGGWPLKSESEKFDHWKNTNYKFMNYAKRSLLGDERVLQAILQPEIRTHEFAVLGRRFFRLISPTHASILTDRELILILEGDRRRGGEDRYGGTWHYVALNKIESLSATRRDERYLTLFVRPAHATPIECVFQSSAEAELGKLIDRFQELTLDR